MAVVKENNSIYGKSDEVIQAIAASYPDIARMTADVLVAMLITEVKKITVNEGAYTRLKNVNVRITTNGDNLTIEIIGGGDEVLH